MRWRDDESLSGRFGRLCGLVAAHGDNILVHSD
jgi:hypothetical protein